MKIINLILLSIISVWVTNIHAQSYFSLAKEDCDSTILEICSQFQVYKLDDQSEYVSLDFTFRNKGATELYLWLGNWRLILLRDNNDWFVNPPIENFWMNYIIIIDDSLNPTNIQYGSPSHQIIPFSGFGQKIKLLRPEDPFGVSIISSDESLISYLIENEFKIKIVSSISKDMDLYKGDDSLWFELNHLNILDLPVEKGPRIRASPHQLNPLYPFVTKTDPVPGFNNSLFSYHFSKLITPFK